jgi:3-oxoacyl-[acyl-carrier protein] reductase
VDLQLRSRKALVTAASRGLGRACAAALACEGASVYIASRHPEAIEAAAREIGAAGWRAADVSVESHAAGLVDAAVAQLGGLDILVVNAGGPSPGTFETTADSDWDIAYQLTLMSAVRLCRSALPHLQRSDQGRIVVITSVSVREPIPNLVLSNSLRAAVTGLAKTLSTEVAASGVTVNCIAPGTILTNRIRELGMTEPEGIPMKRLGDPDELGALCAFLCSSQAGYITGQTIAVDGGRSKGVY